MLAAELEARIEREEERTRPRASSGGDGRRPWPVASGNDVTITSVSGERRRGSPGVRLQVARNLEKSGKINSRAEVLRQDRSRGPRHGRGPGGRLANRCIPPET